MQARTRILSAALAASIPAAAAPQGMAPDGTFGSSGVSLQVIVLPDHAQTTIASTTVVQGDCSGTVAGKATVKGHTLTLAPADDPASACRVAAEFDRNWKQATLRENAACGRNHGASCGWEGQTVKRIELIR